ncbi:hypothetical protein [Marinomonas sp. GJ51-6]|uniref:Y-family DNA polymerase n=1 Tax=Marinomonas sp. GJ51-6 TaxID=2992802 RepID=UPI00293528A4|nr:hypothetical protein [Marinomonas sp. GJ51-6]WOD08427.1 hypothetical protein ONZ50_04775 [Marinomonas sp. GJ51-6]
MSRKIIHIDADCFYASIEMRDDPSLRDIPIAIGAPVDRRSVLATANYAARVYGVRSAMPTSVAKRLCPSLLVIPEIWRNTEKLRSKCRPSFVILLTLLSPLSLDEAYLDVTDSEHFQGSATRIAEKIRFSDF